MSNLILPSGATRREVGPNKFTYSMFPSNAAVKRSDLGAPTIRTSTTSKVYKFRSQRFWAEGGRIQIVDDTNDEYASCTIEEFGRRAAALIGQASALCRMKIWSDERKELVDAIGDMKSAIYDALEQGDPHDPRVMAFRARQRGRKARVGYTSASARPRRAKDGSVLDGTVVGDRGPQLIFE